MTLSVLRTVALQHIYLILSCYFNCSAKTSLFVRKGRGQRRGLERSEEGEDVLHLLPEVLRSNLVGDGTDSEIHVLQARDSPSCLCTWFQENVQGQCLVLPEMRFTVGHFFFVTLDKFNLHFRHSWASDRLMMPRLKKSCSCSRVQMCNLESLVQIIVLVAAAGL